MEAKSLLDMVGKLSGRILKISRLLRMFSLSFSVAFARGVDDLYS